MNFIIYFGIWYLILFGLYKLIRLAYDNLIGLGADIIGEENTINITSITDKEVVDYNEEIVDDELDKYNLFVERKEDKLDTEPKDWNEYIGQGAVKETIKETLQALEQDITLPYPHILISGNAGYGKSALIHLLALKSNLHLIETCAGNLQEPKDIYNLLSKLRKEPPYSIIFIDEIHGVKKEIGELLLPAVQMFKVNNRPIPYFCLAGATTDLGAFTEKLSPLVDRCKQQFVLKPYSNEELATIIKNIIKKRDMNIKDDALLEIASRSRQTPRLAIGNLDKVWYYSKAKNINTITKKEVIDKLEKLGIHEKGITDRDIELLEYLNRQEKPVGQSAITQKLNIDKKTYLFNTEPFLVRHEYLSRTPRGRIISPLGREIIKEIKK